MENDIWALEESWYSHHRDGSPDLAYALVHDDFRGWPTIASPGINKAGLIAVISEEDKNVASSEFELTQHAIQVVGSTAINHYTVEFAGKFRDGSEFNECLNVTHTWIREGTQWKLISGMAYEA